MFLHFCKNFRPSCRDFFRDVCITGQAQERNSITQGNESRHVSAYEKTCKLLAEAYVNLSVLVVLVVLEIFKVHEDC